MFLKLVYMQLRTSGGYAMMWYTAVYLLITTKTIRYVYSYAISTSSKHPLCGVVGITPGCNGMQRTGWSPVRLWSKGENARKV